MEKERKELNLAACLRLANAVVEHALAKEVFHERRTPAVLRKWALELELFSRSKFIDLFADANGFEVEQVRKAILERSKLMEERANQPIPQTRRRKKKKIFS